MIREAGDRESALSIRRQAQLRVKSQLTKDTAAYQAELRKYQAQQREYTLQRAEFAKYEQQMANWRLRLSSLGTERNKKIGEIESAIKASEIPLNDGSELRTETDHMERSHVLEQ